MKVQKKEHTSARALLLFFSAFLITGTSEAQLAAGNAAPVSGMPGTSEPAAAQSTYRLIGTVEGGAFTGAVLDDAAAGGQTFYRLRETLPDGSQIVKVRSDSISVKRSDGMVYELYIIHDMKVSAPSAGPPASAGQAVPRFTDNQRTSDMQTRAARPLRPDRGTKQGTSGLGSNTAAPEDSRVRRVPRQQRRAPQSPD
jgi:hypothetical protein